jgi:hypothetical protein
VKSGIRKHVPHETSAQDEALLRDAARAELLRRLAPTLRHDLNSPVQSAFWAFDLMQRGVESHPDATQRAKLLTSLELGRREIARLQAAARVFVSCAAPLDEPPASFDLREVLGEIDRLTAAEAAINDVRITFQMLAGPLSVRGVRADIQLALLQLALESLDDAGSGGTLAVEMAATDAHATVRFIATPKDAAKIAAEGAHASANGKRVTESIATSHKGHVLRRQSTGSMEAEFAIARG